MGRKELSHPNGLFDLENQKQVDEVVVEMCRCHPGQALPVLSHQHSNL